MILAAASPSFGDIPASVAPSLLGFTLGEALGEGGFARVWAARREQDGAPVAIKIGHSRGAVLIERFRREASALERIGPPHVAQLYRLGQIEDGRPYLAMERLFGRTLAEELRELREPPRPAWAVSRADAILGALAAVHAHGITHRDLKPANIFITEPEARIVLIDFGLSHGEGGSSEAEDDLTRPGVVVGTAAYMAPEQIRHGPKIDARADLYAFGVLLFELLTLRTPFLGEAGAIEHGHLALRPPRPSEFAPVPAELDELTLACLAKDPARRPTSIAELRAALAAACAMLAQPPPSAAASSSGRARLVAESGHPAVLLVAETSGATPLVVAAVTDRGGFVVRRHGHRYVSVFPAGETEDSPAAALAAARDLVEQHGARAALHLGSVTLRYREQGVPSVYGAPVDRPEAWLPSEPWSGLRWTAEVEQILGEAARASGAAETVAEEVAPLVGRDDVRATLAESAVLAFDGTCPGLFTLLGDNGLGKTRLAAVAANVVRGVADEVRVVSLRAAGRVPEAGHAPETAALLRALLSGGSEDTLPPRRDLVRVLGEGLRRRAREGPLAVILDDAHRADDALLDALEYASLDGAGVRLWVVVVGHPRLDAQRPMWGARTQRHDRVVLSPLDEGAGEALAAWLLRPADYPPIETLRRLTDFAGGNPACMVDVVRSLRRAGAVRKRPNGRGYDVATEALSGLPPLPSRQWLAARRLAELPSALAALARICAVLGPTFTEGELEVVLDGLDRAGGAGSPLDAGVGLSELAAREIVARTAGFRWSFPSAVLREATAALIDPAHRAAIHRQALAYWRVRAAAAGLSVEYLSAVALHAAGCGERAEAAQALLSLGEAALSQHRYVEADVRCSAALGFLGAEDAPLRTRALVGRGKARYRIHRAREAREDFAAALSLSEELGDLRRQAETLLEDATALDWDQQFEASARRVEEARPIVAVLGDPRLALRLKVAEGRTCHRRRETEASIELFSEASAEALTLSEIEPLVIAGLLLSFDLASVGRLEEAEQRFGEVIAIAEAMGDLPHLGAAYINRVTLWMARGLTDRALLDLQRVVALAREIGNPWLEHAAAYNVALMLYRSDAPGEAFAFARRACLLADRAVEAPVPAPQPLLAEILLLREEYEEAAHLVEAMRASDAHPDLANMLRQQMLRLVLSELGIAGAPSPPEGGWEQTMRFAEERGLSIEGKLKLLYWRARMALAGGRLSEARSSLDAARSHRAGRTMWLRRFEALEVQLASTAGAHC
jgi:tetratricopeptide (TPR) repeat protein